jgi:hypothetical protein
LLLLLLLLVAAAVAACCCCHQATYSLLASITGKDLRPAAKPVAEKSGQGTITIMPYE